MKRISKIELEDTLEEYLKYRLTDNGNTTKTKFIAIEGMDGVGKEYTSNKLRKYLTDLGFYVKLISFPVYSSCTGEEVKKVLSGSFGDPFLEVILTTNPNISDYLRSTRKSKDTKKDVNEVSLDYMDNVNRIINDKIVYKNKAFKNYHINNLHIDVVKNKYKDVSSTLLSLEKPTYSKILKSSDIVINEILSELIKTF